MDEAVKEWVAVEDWSDLKVGDTVRVVTPVRVGQIEFVEPSWGDDDVVNIEVSNPDVELDIYSNEGYTIEREIKRDIRNVRDLVANLSSISQRNIVVTDPYGVTHNIAFGNRLGFNVYPSGTVTIASADGPNGAIYIQGGINGTVEVL